MTVSPPKSLQDTRVTRVFEAAKAEGRPAMMPFVTVGWPELTDTPDLIEALIEGGADLIEVGIPFSDPIADGPTVQKVSQKALENGATPRTALEAIREVRNHRGVEAPLLFMGYYNPILAYGLEAFARDSAEAGIDGLIVPDLPPEESDQLLEACIQNGIHLIYFLAPTSNPERVDAVLKRANGFIYLVAVVGITGAREQLWEGLSDYVSRVRRHTDLPLAIGFGISSRDHVVAAGEMVDGVIFASGMLNHLEQAPRDQLLREATSYVRSLNGGGVGSE